MYILKGNHPICKRLDARVKTWKEMIKFLEDWTDKGYEVTIENIEKIKITVCYTPLPSDHNQKIREKINDKIKQLIDRRKKKCQNW